MKNIISFQVVGKPIAQPRHKFSCRGRFAKAFIPKGHPIKPWRKLVRRVAREAIKNRVPLKTACVVIAFYFPRPPSHLTTKGRLRKGQSEQHRIKPDLDNLAKPILDEMTTAGFWHDDSVVIELVVSKNYADPHEQGWVDVHARELSHEDI